MKLTHKLLIIFLGISLIPLIIFSIVNYNEFETSIISDQKTTLESIIQSQESDINHLIQLRQEQAKMIAGTFLVRQLDSSGMNDDEILERLQIHIKSIHEEISLFPTSNYDTIDKRSAINIIGVWDTEGIIVANTQKTLIGEKMPDEFLEEVKKSGTYFAGFQADPLTGKNFLIFLEIIRDFEDERFAGAIIMKVQAEILNQITNQLGDDIVGFRDSGELYLVNSDYLMITESRNVRDGILKQNVESDVILDCFNGVETFGEYINFRDEHVIGKTKYLSDQNWCLVGEVDLEAALSPVSKFRNQVLVAIALIAGLTLGLGVYFSRGISRPIISLQQSAEEITVGNFDTEINVKGSDEISKLSIAMDKMRLSVKKSIETEKKLDSAQEMIDLEAKMSKEKEEYVAMISHDLKQPLVPIQGNAEMLNMKEMGELNEMQKECVTEILAATSRQLAMIDNLVSAQKLGANAMTYDIEEFSSKEILNDCIHTHTPIMKDKNIEYFDSSTEDIKIKVDKRRILESFTNIIQNAHDFVPQDGKVEIGMNDGKKEVTFFVKDNGEGIPKDKQDKLFKKYGQVESKAKRKFGGTGLGLAVSQELVNGMGGKIWFESDVGKGTTFFFTIPKA